MADLRSIQKLIAKEVTRKEFLQYIGVGILGSVGVTRALQNMHGLKAKRTVTRGFGSGPYGS